jgi:hypothetical protein
MCCHSSGSPPRSEAPFDEQHRQSGGEHREGQQDHQLGDQDAPGEQWQAEHAHAWYPQVEDGGDQVDGAKHAADPAHREP